MNIGTKVIRKSDLAKNIPIFGEIESIIDNKAGVHWHDGSVVSTGKMRVSVIGFKSLVEATPEIQRRVRENTHKRHEERLREQMAERIFVCTNVNPYARVSNDGHPKPLELALGQVKDGHCWYCGAPIFKRCSVWDCCTPVIEGSEYCEAHTATEELPCV